MPSFVYRRARFYLVLFFFLSGPDADDADEAEDAA